MHIKSYTQAKHALGNKGLSVVDFKVVGSEYRWFLMLFVNVFGVECTWRCVGLEQMCFVSWFNVVGFECNLFLM